MRQAEFVGAVVVPFVLDDFRQFFVSPLRSRAWILGWAGEGRGGR